MSDQHGIPTLSEEEADTRYRSGKYCHADRDGECHWKKCPQLKDGEPEKSGRHCPLDFMTEEY
jgi:hypothetical protein